jgi:hypothetical protein
VVIALVAIVTLFGGNAALAATPSTISIGFNHDTEHFHGKVRSSDAECEAGRTVKLFEKTAGGRTLQGTATTTVSGSWDIELMHAEGFYIAVTPKEKAMHTTCGRAASRVVDVM